MWKTWAIIAVLGRYDQEGPIMYSVTALASAIIAIVAAGPVAKWPVFVPSDGGFRVQMPGPVDEATETVETDLALLTQKTFTCSTTNAMWRVSYVDLPRHILSEQSPEDILRSAQAGSRYSNRMEVFSEAAPKRPGAHSKRFRTVVHNGPMVSHLLVLKSNRLYHLMVLSPPDKFRRVGTVDFFGSFELD